MNRWNLLLWLTFVIVPLRNAHFFDAMAYLERQEAHLQYIFRDFQLEPEQAMARLKEIVADRCVVADCTFPPDAITFGCIQCDERWRDADAYIFHECGIDKSDPSLLRRR